MRELIIAGLDWWEKQRLHEVNPKTYIGSGKVIDRQPLKENCAVP
jgi:hypothetical protein